MISKMIWNSRTNRWSMPLNQNVQRLYDLLENVARSFPDRVSFRKRGSDGKSFPGISFAELKNRVDWLVAGLIQEGVAIGDRITYLCDSSPNWILGDLAILASGAVSVPRGTDVVDEDIIYILSHSESRYAIVQTQKEKERLESLREKHFPTLEKIFVLEKEKAGELAKGAGTVWELMERGKELLSQKPDFVSQRIQQTDPEALATLIYTSGTTGVPKGVMLSQSGWITAILSVIERLRFTSDDRGVSLLPPWHAFERAVEYAILALGIEFAVSNMSTLKDDLRDFQPTIFPSVPRIWESVHSGILGKISKAGGIKEALFRLALGIGTLWSNRKAILFGYDTQIYPLNPVISLFRRFFSFLILILLLPAKGFAMLIFSPIHKALGGKLCG